MINAQILRPGVYALVVTPFINDSTEEIDLESFKENIFRLVKSGIGIVIGGTLGEGPLLGREGRITLIEAAREVIQHEVFNSNVPLIAAVVGASFRESLQQSIDAANGSRCSVYESGALIEIDKALTSHRIMVAPAYFSSVYGKNRAALKDFFTSVADGSPLPVFLYNVFNIQLSQSPTDTFC
jgi:4-hydroxy-2-oxoglutarate aldolase